MRFSAAARATILPTKVLPVKKMKSNDSFRSSVFCLLAAGHGGHGARVEIFRDQLEQHVGRRRQRLTQCENAGVAGRECRQCRANQQQQGSVEWPDDQRHAIGFAIDHPLVAGLGEEAGHRRFDRLHPLLQLALLDLCLARRRLGLEDVFLRGGLEVLGHRLLEALFVLPDHAGHAVELFDAPLVGAGDSCGEKRLLRVEDFLKSIHRDLARCQVWRRTARAPERID